MGRLLKASGLVTKPNELNKKEGSLEIATNVVIDADNIIEPRRGMVEFGDSLPSLNDRVKQVLLYKNRIFRHYNSSISFDSTGTGTFSTFNGSYTEPLEGMRIKSFEMNSNFYFTTDEGIKKISALTSSDFSTSAGYITDAGGVKASSIYAELDFTSEGFLSPQSKVSYRAVWGIRDNNNVLVLGSPSARYVVTNNSSDVNTAESFELTFSSGTINNYDDHTLNRYILIYSTTSGYYVWFSSTAHPEAPVDSSTVGKIGIEVNIQGLSSSSQIAAATASELAKLDTIFSVEVNSNIITVTSLESGENLEDPTVSAGLTVVVANVTTQGQVTIGQSANCSVKIVVPSEITNVNYFYQIYRTSIITADTPSLLSDLDPGDEHNLAYEANITLAEIAAKEVLIVDITTEAFRASGTTLYTNPNTGEGILNANERPPIAKDITIFRNAAFYANTKTLHKTSLNLLSVSNFISGSSNIVIGNALGFRTYTFVGATEVYSITCDTFANTTNSSYILLNSARNERKYYIWFDKGGGVDPSVVSRQGIRVNIAGTTTAITVSAKIYESLKLITDFTVVDNLGSVQITLAKNGNTDDIALGSTPPGGSWVVAVTTQGDGEDSALNEVLLSSLYSVGQAIEETAISLVEIINKDSLGYVNAQYISGSEDVPGKISLENRSLEDIAFFIGTEDSNITSKFNPELPLAVAVSGISATNPTTITSTSHGLLPQTKLYFYDTDSTPALLGEYKITVTGANTFTIPTSITVAGANGYYFLADVKSDNEVAPNRLYFSKSLQPEAVPVLNYLDIGPKDKAIYRILPLRDRLFVFKEDGIYIIAGSSSPNFTSALLDSSSQILAPDSATVVSNKIYCLTTQGVVQVSEGGVLIYSQDIEDIIKGISNSKYNYKYTSFGVSYETDRSYLLWMPTTREDTVATQCFRFNADTSTWTRFEISATSGIVNPYDDKMYIGSGDRNFIDVERKNFDRTDYSDRSFIRSFGTNGLNGDTISISSASNVTAGDVILQKQYVTIAQVNRLLLKLDKDLGITDSDYFDSLNMIPGDNITNKLDSLNLKLLADDLSGVITSRSFSSNFETIQTQFNDMISELNILACDTIFKDYTQSTDYVEYETLIIKSQTAQNLITVSVQMPFIVGDLYIYKGYSCTIAWAPQDFGQPEALKQVREGTIIVDQTSFYSGTLSYASDLSANFEDINFTLNGPGDFGSASFGEGTWGGNGNEIPIRTLIPMAKQRCRFIRVKFNHTNARELFRILGLSLEPRVLSTRGYR